MHNKSNYIVQGALIAALYVILTIFSNLFGLASGIIQVRLSEALTVLPIFIPAAVPGLFVGCLIANVLTGCALLDIILGALATLVGAYGTLLIGRHKPHSRLGNSLASIPPILVNTLVIPPILAFVYNFEGSIIYFASNVFIGELISAGLLGQLLLKALVPYKDKIGF